MIIVGVKKPNPAITTATEATPLRSATGIRSSGRSRSSTAGRCGAVEDGGETTGHLGTDSGDGVPPMGRVQARPPPGPGPGSGRSHPIRHGPVSDRTPLRNITDNRVHLRVTPRS
ncbi:hypothetical protein PSA01_12200 [Pseudonocardia saturnea]|uniref:Uncharacterized protein n=1 Tax=Pseudonocardia saturnea TaxID=33909 RepID=A0ABQ0RU50_9PSEU|nr:hypothetical protein Pdca_33860 [Pseudonocardia autotrophica]GEC24191.1 hypothetical protein PSA01_12200 [Pseudonocardia saturnea]